MSNIVSLEDWELVEQLLPRGYNRQARARGAVQRLRGVPLVKNLLRLLMLHISGGLSIEQTCMRASELGITEVTAMSLFKRLKKSRAWLAWMCEQMIAQHKAADFSQGALAGRRVLAIDASDIREPGASGSSWRLHYAISLPDLRCAHAQFTSHKTGENAGNFPVLAGDVIFADRAYGKRAQLARIIESGADAIVRISPTLFQIETQSAGQAQEPDLPGEWLKHLRALKNYEPGEWPVRFKVGKKQYQVRVCAVRKSVTARDKALHDIEVEARKKKRTVRPETFEYAGYVIVVCTLAAKLLDTREVLELYRSRWQVELAFKRLKSLIECGTVPKTDTQSALAWMQGKLLEALLCEKLLEESGALSPWGHRI